ncbi:MAG: hypothetical protein KDA53_04715 [Hyphomonas sp.]|nr:hypothetical protein [Hyphomonas sp.]
MKLRLFPTAALIAGTALLAAPSASASYMGKCNKLIDAWDTCRATGGACKAEQTALETECKCHKQKGEEWKLVMAAVGKDGVCAPDWPPPTIPDPSPPPREDSGDKHEPEQRGR